MQAQDSGVSQLGVAHKVSPGAVPPEGRAGEGATSLAGLLPGLKALAAAGFLPHGPLYGVVELGAAGFPQREGSDPREREEERVSTTGILLYPNPRGGSLTTGARLSVLGSVTSPHPHSREGMGTHRQGSLGPSRRLPTAGCGSVQVSRETEPTGRVYTDRGREAYFKEGVHAIAGLTSSKAAEQAGRRDTQGSIKAAGLSPQMAWRRDAIFFGDLSLFSFKAFCLAHLHCGGLSAFI